MKTKEETLNKLVKWYQRAELCTSRKEARKILKKARKHSRKLSELTNNQFKEQL